MVSVIVVVAIIGVAAWIVWRRRSRWQTSSELSASEEVRPEAQSFEAFTHGNSYLAEGKFDDAIAAFQRARELDPKRPHVADRLAEVERRQRAALAAVPASTPS
jgi:predicted negative regulator of RcsB-dependent stress response